MERRMEKLGNILNEQQQGNKQQSLAEKELQRENFKQYSEEDSDWLKCNSDTREISPMFTLQEQMREARAWKKFRGLGELEKFRLCGKHRETLQHLLSSFKKIVGAEYVKRHNNTLKVFPVKWAVENGHFPEVTRWYTTNWERGKVIEENGKKLL